jgi:hypothetical protein
MRLLSVLRNRRMALLMPPSAGGARKVGEFLRDLVRLASTKPSIFDTSALAMFAFNDFSFSHCSASQDGATLVNARIFWLAGQ